MPGVGLSSSCQEKKQQESPECSNWNSVYRMGEYNEWKIKFSLIFTRLSIIKIKCRRRNFTLETNPQALAPDTDSIHIVLRKLNILVRKSCFLCEILHNPTFLASIRQEHRLPGWNMRKVSDQNKRLSTLTNSTFQLIWNFKFLSLRSFSGGSRSPNSNDGAPKFSQSIQNISSVVGKDAVLNCYVESLGVYKVGWMRSDQTVLSIGKIVTQSSRYSVSHENSNRWSLRIHGVRESDEGCYICQINTQPLLKASGCIQLQFPPDISDAESSSDTTIHEGRDAMLQCKAKGNPQPRIFWRRDDGHPIRIRNNERGVDMTVDIYNGSSLSLHNVKRDQMSAYLCIAVNGVEPAISKRISLHVQCKSRVQIFLSISPE